MEGENRQLRSKGIESTNRCPVVSPVFSEVQVLRSNVSIIPLDEINNGTCLPSTVLGPFSEHQYKATMR